MPINEKIFCLNDNIPAPEKDELRVEYIQRLRDYSYNGLFFRETHKKINQFLDILEDFSTELSSKYRPDKISDKISNDDIYEKIDSICKKIDSLRENIDGQVNKIKEKINKLEKEKKEIKKELYQKMKEKPNTITIRMWNFTPPEKRQVLLGVPSEGHLSLDICLENGERRYISLYPSKDTLEEANFAIQYITTQAHAPSARTRAGYFESLDQDMQDYANAVYCDYNEIVFDCSQRKELDINKIFKWADNILKTYNNENPYQYKFYSANCSAIVLEGLFSAGSKEIISFSHSKNIAFFLDIITPGQVFQYAKQIKIELDGRLSNGNEYSSEKEKILDILDLVGSQILALIYNCKFNVMSKYGNDIKNVEKIFHEDPLVVVLVSIYSSLNNFREYIIKDDGQNLDTILEKLKVSYDAWINSLSENEEYKSLCLEYKDEINAACEILNQIKTCFLDQLNIELKQITDDLQSGFMREVKVDNEILPKFTEAREIISNAIMPYKIIDSIENAKPELLKKILKINDAVLELKNKRSEQVDKVKTLLKELKEIDKNKKTKSAEIDKQSKTIVKRDETCKKIKDRKILIDFYSKNINDLQKFAGKLNQELYFNRNSGVIDDRDNLLKCLTHEDGIFPNYKGGTTLEELIKDNKESFNISQEKWKKKPSRFNLLPSARKKREQRRELQTKEVIYKILNDNKLPNSVKAKEIRRLVNKNKPMKFFNKDQRLNYKIMALKGEMICLLKDFMEGKLDVSGLISQAQKLSQYYSSPKIQPMLLDFLFRVKASYKKNLEAILDSEKDKVSNEPNVKSYLRKNIDTYANIFKVIGAPKKSEPLKGVFKALQNVEKAFNQQNKNNTSENKNKVNLADSIIEAEIAVGYYRNSF